MEISVRSRSWVDRLRINNGEWNLREALFKNKKSLKRR